MSYLTCKCERATTHVVTQTERKKDDIHSDHCILDINVS